MIERLNNRRYFLPFFFIFFIHVLGVLGFLSDCEFLSSTTLLNDDYSIHYSHIEPLRNFFSDSFKFWGYDPFFMAGYPRSTVFDADAKSIELFGLIFSFLDSAIYYKFYVLLNYLLAPLVFLWALKNFGFKSHSLLIGFALVVAYWWNSPAIKFNLAGQFAFIFVSHITILVFSFFYRFISGGKFKDMALAGLFGALGLAVHVLAPINIAIPSIILYLIVFKRLKAREHLLILASLVFILILNSMWIVPFIKYFSMNNLGEVEWFFGEKNPFFFIESYFPGGSIFRYLRLAILIAAVGGLVKWKREGNLMFYPLLGAFVSLFCYAYFGSYATLEFLQNPWRYEFELNLFLILPATLFLSEVFGGKELRIGKKALRIVALIFLLITLFPVNLLKSLKMLTFPRLSYKVMIYDRMDNIWGGKEPLSQELIPNTLFPSNAKKLIEWIAENTTREGRILLEDSCWQTRHAYWGTHIPALLPQYTEREYIGGPLPQYFMKHHFASFQEGIIFGENISKIDGDKLNDYFDLYNIKWVICFTPISRKAFDNMRKSVSLIDKIDKFYIYVVNRKPTFFYNGEGNVITDYNHLYLKNVSGGDVVIKYHWLDTLKTRPHREIERVLLMDDPIGFIKIKEAPEEIEIYNAYE